MPRSTFNMHPCYKHTQTATPACAVQCVSSLSPSCHPHCHSSASLIHVLPGPCTPLSSHARNGSMQNQTMPTVKSNGCQNTYTSTYCDVRSGYLMHNLFTPATYLRCHVRDWDMQSDCIYCGMVLEPCGVMCGLWLSWL